MLNISSKTKSHILVLIFGPHVPLWLPSIVKWLYALQIEFGLLSGYKGFLEDYV